MITLSNADTIRLIKTLSTLTAVRPNSVREYEVWRQNYLLLQKIKRKCQPPTNNSRACHGPSCPTIKAQADQPQ
jgi:hypothetical protein